MRVTGVGSLCGIRVKASPSRKVEKRKALAPVRLRLHDTEASAALRDVGTFVPPMLEIRGCKQLTGIFSCAAGSTTSHETEQPRPGGSSGVHPRRLSFPDTASQTNPEKNPGPQGHSGVKGREREAAVWQLNDGSGRGVFLQVQRSEENS